MSKKINVVSWTIFLTIFTFMGLQLYKVQQEKNTLIDSYVQSISTTALSKTLIEFGKTEKYKYTDKDILNLLEKSTLQSVMYFVENNITTESARATVFNNSKEMLNYKHITKNQKETLEKYLDVNSKPILQLEISNFFRQVAEFFKSL